MQDENMLVRIGKILLEMFDVTHRDFRMKFKIETPTLIFSANKELVVVKYMALEFSEGSLSI